jgi:hypothetical protein
MISQHFLKNTTVKSSGLDALSEGICFMATTRDFFLGRDFRNLAENQKSCSPSRNSATGQKKIK